MDKPIIIDMGRVEDWPITHLKYTCKKNRVKGYTKMSKDELVREVRKILSKYQEAGN